MSIYVLCRFGKDSMMTGISLGVTNSSNQLTSFGVNNNNFAKSKASVYAQKGEPMYQKEMDADEDGIVTFEEFNEYCDNNGIDYKMRIMLLNNRMTYKLSKDNEETSKKVKEEAENAQKAKETEEETKASTEEDKTSILDKIINGDDEEEKITYEEYMKICEEQAKSAPEKDFSSKTETVKVKDAETDEEKVVVKNYGKALKSYSEADSATHNK